jgi:hypothetical protein
VKNRQEWRSLNPEECWRKAMKENTEIKIEFVWTVEMLIVKDGI